MSTLIYYMYLLFVSNRLLFLTHYYQESMSSCTLNITQVHRNISVVHVCTAVFYYPSLAGGPNSKFPNSIAIHSTIFYNQLKGFVSLFVANEGLK